MNGPLAERIRLFGRDNSAGLIPTPPAQRFSDYSENSSIMMTITTQTPGSFGVNNFASVSPNFNRSNGFCNTGKLW